jgi:bifunctional non-homologous end joining protein LigD
MRPIPLVGTVPREFLARLAAGVPRLLTAQPLAAYLPGLSAAARRALPDRFELCLPMTALHPPSGPLWLHEIKHDGFRIVARKVRDRVRLYNHRGDDVARRFPLVVDAMAALPVSSCMIDAEAVACDDNGVPSFELLAWKHNDASVFVYAFDLVELAGEDLRCEPLEQRKLRLRRRLEGAGPGLVLNAWVDGSDFDGETVFEHACSLGLEGIVSKRIGSRYNAGRSPDWLKFKNPESLAVRRETERDWGR